LIVYDIVQDLAVTEIYGGPWAISVTVAGEESNEVEFSTFFGDGSGTLTMTASLSELEYLDPMRLFSRSNTIPKLYQLGLQLLSAGYLLTLQVFPKIPRPIVVARLRPRLLPSFS
jgi:hypothetical protein